MRQLMCGGGLGLVLASLLVGSGESQEAKKPKKNANPAYTTLKDAGPDFGIQGEYVGNAEFPNGEKPKVGAQVVAQGDGKFRIKFHLGGLPGDGWDGKTTRIAHAVTKDGRTIISGKITDPANKVAAKDISGSISQGDLTATVDERTSTFKRLIRHSPTLGAKPPKDAIVLFDGTNADEWKGGKVVEGKLLNNGIYSKRQFKDFKAHLEFRLAFMPFGRGQGRSNSGFYPQGHNYEVQILDSFGLDGKDNECGASTPCWLLPSTCAFRRFPGKPTTSTSRRLASTPPARRPPMPSSRWFRMELPSRTTPASPYAPRITGAKSRTRPVPFIYKTTAIRCISKTYGSWK